MKIQGRKSNPTGRPSGVNGAKGPKAQPVENAPSSTEDRIDISSTSRGVSEIQQALSAVPDIRIEKVEDIRMSVEDGSYHVESEELAKSVVDEALQDAVRRSRRQRELQSD